MRNGRPYGSVVEAVRMAWRPAGAARGAALRCRFARIILSALVACAPAAGCAYRQLQWSTGRQAQTVVDIQYQQVLDNLALFCLNPSALPSLSSLKTGATQVGDTGSLGFLGVAGLDTKFGSSPTIAATRTVVEQWGSAPLTDDNNLLLVQRAFQYAMNDRRRFTADEADDLAHDLSSQIGTTADISVDRDTLGHLFSQGEVSGALARLKPPEPERRNPHPGTLEEREFRTQQREELRDLADRLAEINENISSQITNTLDERIVTEAFRFKGADELGVRLHAGSVHRTFRDEPRPGEDPKPDEEQNIVFIGTAFREGDLRLEIIDDQGKCVVQMSEMEIKKRDEGDKVRLEEDEQDFRYIRHKLQDVTPSTDLYRSTRRQLVAKVVSLLEYNHETLLERKFVPLGSSATGEAKEAIYRVNDAQETLDKIHPGWYYFGSEKPKNACYVGHACFCGRECFVWVCRDGLEELSNFTRSVLKLGSTFKDVQIVTAPSGIQFAPALTNTPR
jgi:hypothetical protein